MNPDSTISTKQIAAIFQYYNLAVNPKISRIKVGFNNEVYEVDRYILKIYLRKNALEKLNNEEQLFRLLESKVLVPKVVVGDNSKKLIPQPFIIYYKIAGDSLGMHWHELSNNQQKSIIKDLIVQIKLVSGFFPDPKLTPPQSWEHWICSEIEKNSKWLDEKSLLPRSTINKINNFLNKNRNVLKRENLKFVYWDVHLDNMIINDQSELVGLVDFEHAEVASIDYILHIVRKMSRYPELYLIGEAQKDANPQDYVKLMTWYREFYPDLFEFPSLDLRLDLYELGEILRQVPRFPNTTDLGVRLRNILAQ